MNSMMKANTKVVTSRYEVNIYLLLKKLSITLVTIWSAPHDRLGHLPESRGTPFETRLGERPEAHQA